MIKKIILMLVLILIALPLATASTFIEDSDSKNSGSSNWNNAANTYDGDWSTYGGSNAGAYSQVTETYNNITPNDKVYFKAKIGTGTNYTIDITDYVIAGTVITKIESIRNSVPQRATMLVYNGSDYVHLKTDNSSYIVYEGALIIGRSPAYTYFSFDNYNSSYDGVINDGYLNNGSLINVVNNGLFVNGNSSNIINNSISFNGVDEYITLNEISGLGQDDSFSFFFKIQTFDNSNAKTIFAQTTSTNERFGFAVESAKLTTALYNGSDYKNIVSWGGAVSQFQDYWIGIRYNGTNLTVWIDNTTLTDSGADTPPSSVNIGTVIGTRTSASSAFYNGTIYYINKYDYALTDEEFYNLSIGNQINQKPSYSWGDQISYYQNSGVYIADKHHITHGVSGDALFIFGSEYLESNIISPQSYCVWVNSSHYCYNGNYYVNGSLVSSFTDPFTTTANILNVSQKGEYDELYLFENNITIYNIFSLYQDFSYDLSEDYTIFTVVYNLTGDNVQEFNLSITDLNTSITNNYTTNVGFIAVNLTDSHTYSIDLSSNYSDRTNSSFSGSTTAYTFIVYDQESITFNFYDITTNNLINNVTVELIGTIESYNATAVNGTTYINMIVPDTYTIRYSADNYSEEFYYYTLTDRSHTTLNLYLIPTTTTTQVTVTVYDQTTLNTLSGAIVYCLRYDQLTNTFNLLGTYETDPAGNAYFDVDIGQEFYKFYVDYPTGTRKLITDKFYIQSETINLYISLTENIADTYFDQNSITYTASYINTTKEFSISWVDSSNVADNYCLYIKKYGTYSKEIVNSSCSTSATGSIQLGGLVENVTYYAIFTANINNDERIITTFWKDLTSGNLNLAGMGLFLTIIIFIIMVFLSAWHILGLIFGMTSLIFAKFFGLLPLSWPVLLGVFTIALIVGVIIQSRK